MKKLVFSLFALLAISGSARAQKVSVPDVEAVPGETVSFAVSLSDGLADTYTAMTLNVQFPATGFTTTGAYTVSASWPAASGVVGDVDAEGLAVIPFSSANVIAGTAVDDLVTVNFTVAPTVAIGEYDVTLKQTLFEYGISDKVYAADVTFKVKVVARHNLTLDENSTVAPEDATDVNVLLKRTIKAGNWSTICLPFAVTGEQVKAAFGDDVQLAKFTAWSSSEDDEGAIVGIDVNFTSTDAADGIDANTPMLIKTSSDITTATFEGVTLEPDDEPVVQVGKKSSERGYFYGTYVSMKVPEENVFLRNNKFWYSTGKTTTKGYRGYFKFYDVLDAYYDVAGVRLNFFLDDVETGIEGVNTENVRDGKGEIYNLGGQRLGRVQKGVNIVNGKKVMAK